MLQRMIDLPPGALLCGAVAALLVGFSKTGVPGLGVLIVPLMVSVFPAKRSVGALLPMLIFGDLFAVSYYHRHAEWKHLVRLLPWVALGMAGGAWLLDHLTDRTLRPALGGMVLSLLVVDAVRRRLPEQQIPTGWWFAALAGVFAGIATTVGNAAGAIMCIYLLSMRLPKHAFIGTGAWYYLIVNCAKIPIFARRHMITAETLRFDLCTLPVIALGAFLGIRLLPRIPQKPFERVVVVLAVLASIRLLFP